MNKTKLLLTWNLSSTYEPVMQISRQIAIHLEQYWNIVEGHCSSPRAWIIREVLGMKLEVIQTDMQRKDISGKEHNKRTDRV